jgi:uncharacterized protein (TIGR02453 family)
VSTRYFTPAVFEFLRELDANNHRDWWEANKHRYTRTVREPALDFIEDFGERLKAISPHFVADTRTNGGSLMRPYRDIRFSSDKTPYKTNIGIQFRHESGRDIQAPGFYLHVEPAQSFAAVGLWHPETAVARTIRQAINDNASEWHKAAHSDAFTEVWSIGEHETDRLKRLPGELDPTHPFPDDLRLKSFTAGTRLSQRTVVSTGFPQDLLGLFQKAAPFTRFLCDATAVPF